MPPISPKEKHPIAQVLRFNRAGSGMSCRLRNPVWPRILGPRHSHAQPVSPVHSSARSQPDYAQLPRSDAARARRSASASKAFDRGNDAVVFFRDARRGVSPSWNQLLARRSIGEASRGLRGAGVRSSLHVFYQPAEDAGERGEHSEQPLGRNFAKLLCTDTEFTTALNRCHTVMIRFDRIVALRSPHRKAPVHRPPRTEPAPPGVVTE